jgi:hypothetical protein
MRFQRNSGPFSCVYGLFRHWLNRQKWRFSDFNAVLQIFEALKITPPENFEAPPLRGNVRGK